MAHDFSNPPPIGSDFHDHLSTPFPNFLAIDPNMDHFQFTDQPNPTLKATDLDTSPVILLSASNFQNLPMSFPEFPGGSADAFPRTMFHPGEHVSGLVPRTVPAMGNGLCDSRKRKAPDVFGTNFGKSDEGGAKRLKNAGKVEGEEQDEEEEQEEEEQEKPKKGAHARARRGQATDSHSLAERVRRGRIKERLRCLQDIVPGCYKTMGLAVMLDETINYVQSLQNQVEFLSMKLTAASSYYDFNSESDAIDEVQRAMAGEAKRLQRAAREGSSEGNESNNFHTVSWHP